jgi:hypothetical protein
MKKIFFALFLLTGLAAGAQEASEVRAAAKGVNYGQARAVDANSVWIDKLEYSMPNGQAFTGSVVGKVKEVCQTMGCWMKLEKSDGTTVMVKMKEHSFFLPKDIVGHTVEVAGVASVKEETEAKRKHYAEDAGKSKADIAKIKGPSKEVQIEAAGVYVME